MSSRRTAKGTKVVGQRTLPRFVDEQDREYVRVETGEVVRPDAARLLHKQPHPINPATLAVAKEIVGDDVLSLSPEEREARMLRFFASVFADIQAQDAATPPTPEAPTDVR